jgi:hypothetical protein
MISAWYLVPLLRRLSLNDALSVLLWFHVFRYTALQVFASGEVGGLEASDTAMRAVAFGDTVTALLAMITLVLLRYRFVFARTFAWITATVATLDLINAMIVGLGEEMVVTATDVGWILFTLYVPFLWITAGLMFWQLATRRSDALHGAPAAA